MESALASAAPLLCEGVSPLPEGVRQRAERVTSGIQNARQFIKDSVERRAAKALQIVDQALSSAAESLARCNPGKAKSFLEQLDREVHASCLTEIQSGKKSSLEEKSQELEKEIQKKIKRIEEICGEAEKTLKECKWKALNDQITEARQSLESLRERNAT